MPLVAKAGMNASPAEAIRSAQALTLPGRESAQFGIWEASVGSFRRDVVAGEIMTILSGAAIFSADDGRRFEMAAGDTLVFPPHTTGIWEIQATLRKLYVLV